MKVYNYEHDTYGLKKDCVNVTVIATDPNTRVEHYLGVLVPQKFRVLGLYNAVKEVHGYDISNWDVRLEHNSVPLPRGNAGLPLEHPVMWQLSVYTSITRGDHLNVLFKVNGTDLFQSVQYKYMNTQIRDYLLEHYKDGRNQPHRQSAISIESKVIVGIILAVAALATGLGIGLS